MKAMGPAAAADERPGRAARRERDNFRSSTLWRSTCPAPPDCRQVGRRRATGATNSKPIPPGPSQMTLDMAGYATSLSQATVAECM